MFELRPYTRNFVPGFFSTFRDFDDMERRLFGADTDRLPGFKTDIREEDGAYLLDADLPGCEKKDIKLELNGETLTISAERHSAREEKDKKGNYVCCERSYGMYRRSFDVSAIDTDNIAAKYENGVLHLTMPKKAPTLPTTKTLEIQ